MVLLFRALFVLTQRRLFYLFKHKQNVHSRGAIERWAYIPRSFMQTTNTHTHTLQPTRIVNLFNTEFAIHRNIYSLCNIIYVAHTHNAYLMCHHSASDSNAIINNKSNHNNFLGNPPCTAIQQQISAAAQHTYIPYINIGEWVYNQRAVSALP